ncbi:MAG: hypothetical protein FE78DRAFT_28093 [Acidomyces sp. 'richmondensis']|nr:MAG: hypothetical protein FE78DRAFT_28093 [Acidomyces sp. 'richmondensis']
MISWADIIVLSVVGGEVLLAVVWVGLEWLNGTPPRQSYLLAHRPIFRNRQRVVRRAILVIILLTATSIADRDAWIYAFHATGHDWHSRALAVVIILVWLWGGRLTWIGNTGIHPPTATIHDAEAPGSTDAKIVDSMCQDRDEPSYDPRPAKRKRERDQRRSRSQIHCQEPGNRIEGGFEDKGDNP